MGNQIARMKETPGGAATKQASTPDHAPSSANDPNEAVKSVGSLVFYKNLLLFENTAYQMSSITSLWVDDQSYKIKNDFPTWIIVLFGLTLAFFVAGYFSHEMYWYLAAVLALAGALFGTYRYEAWHHVPKFALAIELNSGRRTYFTHESRDFIQRATNSLMQALLHAGEIGGKLVMNFHDNRISVEKAINSNIVNGDILGSTVNTMQESV